METTLNTAKALADLNRLRVVSVLMEHEELCVCQITALLDLATPTVSRHMNVLYTARLVQSRKAGRWVYFRLSDSFPPVLRQWLAEALATSAGAAADRASVQQILACDRGELCRCQRVRRRDSSPDPAGAIEQRRSVKR